MIAEYWKNGIVSRLTDGSNYARANSIIVSGSDVYAAGAEFKDGNYFVAKYWLNGVEKAITDSSNYSMASCIALWDQDIYIAGKKLQGAFMQGPAVAQYWKNGNEIPVQDSSHAGGWTNSVFIAENISQEHKKKRTYSYHSVYREQTHKSNSSGNTLSSVFHATKKSPTRSYTTHKESHSYRENRSTNSHATRSKQNRSVSKRK